MPLQNRVTPFSELVAHPGAACSTGTAGACMTMPGASGGDTAHAAGIACRRGVPRLGSEARAATRGSSPSCSSSTRSPRSPPGTGPARSAGAPTTCAWARSGATFIRARPEPTRSTCNSTVNGRPRTRAQLQHEAPIGDLPDGAFVRDGDMAWLVLGRQLLRWTPAGYGERRPRPTNDVAIVITPPSLLERSLRTDWRPLVPGGIPP